MGSCIRNKLSHEHCHSCALLYRSVRVDHVLVSSAFPVDFLCGMPPVIHASCFAAQVACRPALSPLTFDAVPSNLLPHSCISDALDPKEWARLQAATFEQYGDQYVSQLLPQLSSQQASVFAAPLHCHLHHTMVAKCARLTLVRTSTSYHCNDHHRA